MDTGSRDRAVAVVIEDDESLAYIYRVALEGVSFSTAVYFDGMSGLQAVQALCPSLVLVDINLPHVNGIEILKVIRKDPALKSTHVILTTADPEKMLALEFEPDLALVKPVSSSQLQELASRLVYRSSLSEE